MSIKKILVIDDEDDLRNLIQTCLELMGGWKVLSAASGKAGLVYWQKEKSRSTS
jgi:CheY-like chemotaxis protein